MTAITASMVKELREKTDAPMMECKKALAEAGGDLGRAEEILRVKLGNKASKAAARVAAEGVVALWIADDAKLGALVEVNSETDFVAKNDDFLAFARALAERVGTQAPADVDALTQLSIDGGTVEQVRTALVGRIGENITVRRFARLQAKGRLASYVHGGSKIGVMVDLVGGDDTLARDLAMHIAASKPRALSREGVPAADVERERSIAQQKADEEQAKAKAEGKAGKPPEIVAKMVDGAVQKYLKEVTLLGQPFVKDDKQTVEQLLKARGAQVAQFVLFVVGEGIERKQSDFAAEVAAQAAAAAGR
ncbi:MAG: translation elongation factor Ts [Burkholderiaceae bacterium]|jgi:elongation factor Ts|nr:translation elongation factor Ts [Burkholderiaceae bacterium]